jgi:hypothetical protein
MSERFDRYNLAARLEKLGDELMTACEKGDEIENRVAVCNQAGAVCRIVMTLKALRMEDRRGEPDAAIARQRGAEICHRVCSPSPSGQRRKRRRARNRFIITDATDSFAEPADE